jgi:amidase
LNRAQELDDHLDQGKPPLGPLHGVPISLKDTFKVKGYDSSLGIAALAFKPASENSVLVDCLLRAGAVLYCKTNVPQTLMALDSHNNVFGRTLNPINTQLTAGGSSGGEGALIAMRVSIRHSLSYYQLFPHRRSPHPKQGSILGIGTDVGGSIRIPSMCNSLYGVKPSWQRIPYAGQQGVQAEGMSKLGIPASAGPIATSMRDIDLFFRAVSEQEPWRLDPDVVPSPWTSMSSISDARVRGRKKLRIGVVRRDGIVEPHPPILRLLDEVASRMERTDIEVVNMDVDIEPLFKQCQSLANALFGIDGGNFIFDLLEATNEPLSPWLQTRLKRKNPLSLEQVGELQARRTALQKSFSKVWDSSGIDAFICPVAPHPVPPIDRWNSVSYTSSFVLLDYPAGVIPVRTFERKDMEGEMTTERTGGSWDRANRELCK